MLRNDRASSSRPSAGNADGSGSGGGSYIEYRGHVVSSIASDKLLDVKDGAMVVDPQGTIVFVGKASEVREFAETSGISISDVHDYGDRLLCPGFIDMHLHLPQVTETGKSGEHLMGWLEKYIFPSEARFRDRDYAEKIALWFFDELARNGTTMAVVFTTIHKDAADVAFSVAAEKGSRAIIGKVMMDNNAPPSLTERLEDSLTESEELCLKWHGYDEGRLQYAFTPRFAVTSTPELLRETGRLWNSHQGTYMHTHLAESAGEIQLVSELFPEARTYLDVYGDAGLTGPRSVLAHSIHLDSKDLFSLKESDSSLAHCPSSNFFLKSGVFRYREVEAHGIKFGMGSDVAAGPQMSMLGVMKDANYIQPNDWISPVELFYRATLGAAEALHQGSRLGSLAPGKEADFTVLDPTRRTGIPDDILSQPTEDILSALVFLGDDRVVERTFVRGREIYSVEAAQSANLV